MIVREELYLFVRVAHYSLGLLVFKGFGDCL